MLFLGGAMVPIIISRFRYRSFRRNLLLENAAAFLNISTRRARRLLDDPSLPYGGLADKRFASPLVAELFNRALADNRRRLRCRYCPLIRKAFCLPHWDPRRGSCPMIRR
jgi:hypothetical protein